MFRETMCGGAIISDFISAPQSRRLTADYLLPDLKKSGAGKRFSKPLRSEIFDVIDDDFEADFQVFKDDSDVEEDNDLADVKPFSFSARSNKPTFSRGNLSHAYPGFWIFILFYSFKLIFFGRVNLS